MKMRQRLILVYGITALAVFGLSYVFIHAQISRRFERFIQKSQQNAAEQIVFTIEDIYLTHRDWDTVQLLARSILGPRFAEVTITGMDGSELLSVQRRRHRQRHGRDSMAPGRHRNAETMRPEFSTRLISLPIFIDGQQYGNAAITLIVPETSPGFLEKIYLTSIQNTMLLSALLSLAIFVIIGLGIAGTIARPVEQVAKAANLVAEGRFESRAPVSGDAELASLARSFNTMAASLEDREEQQRIMSSDIAHELRTPVTVLKSHLEAFQEGVMTAGQAEIGSLLEEALRLERIINDLKAIWQLEAEAQQGIRQPIQVDQALALIEQRAAPLVRKAGITLTLALSDTPLIIQGTPEAFDRAVWNILTNAVRYATAAIEIRAEKKQQTVFISITDDGPGLPEEAIPRIFERFYRADNSRDRSTGGAGLGLAIAKQAALFLGGNISAANNKNKGCSFVITLPVS